MPAHLHAMFCHNYDHRECSNEEEHMAMDSLWKNLHLLAAISTKLYNAFNPVSVQCFQPRKCSSISQI